MLSGVYQCPETVLPLTVALLPNETWIPFWAMKSTCPTPVRLLCSIVADEPLGRLVDPLDDSRRVEDVARDADAMQSLLDVAADSQASGHRGNYGRSRTPASSLSACRPPAGAARRRRYSPEPVSSRITGAATVADPSRQA